MKKTNLFLVCVSFVIGFCTVLGFALDASAQDRVETPADADGVCVALITELSAGGITTEEISQIQNVCIYQETMALDLLEGVMDRLNGPQPRPTFGTWADAIAQLNSCRHIDEVICPNTDEEIPPPPPRDRPRSRLIVECRGACAEGPGITDGLRGRGWRAVAVCREGTVPLTYSYRHAVVEGEELERRHREDGVTLDIVYCYDPSSRTAPSVPPTDYARVDLSDLWNHIHRLEHACGEHGMRDRDMETGTMERSPDWEELCTRFDTVLEHTTQITNLEIALSTLRDDLNALTEREDERWAADCGKTHDEWAALSEDDRLTLIRSGQCDGASTTVVNHGDWRLHLHLGLAFHGLGITAPAGILAPHGVVYAEFEALPVEHFGFFLRGYIGAGNLLDRIGQFNPEGTIGDEGIFGGSVGPTFRFNEMFALDVGLAASAVFNPGGQIGSSLHTWPVFQLGGEARLRVNPVDWFHIEGTVGLDYTHAEVRRPNIDRFIGIDNVGYHLSLGLGVTF